MREGWQVVSWVDFELFDYDYELLDCDWLMSEVQSDYTG
jgi:hypothetical protein